MIPRPKNGVSLLLTYFDLVKETACFLAFENILSPLFYNGRQYSLK